MKKKWKKEKDLFYDFQLLICYIQIAMHRETKVGRKDDEVQLFVN